MKKKWAFPMILILIFYISGCSENKSDIYAGETLQIMTIGNAPKIKEENILFTSMTLEDLEQSVSSVDGDAVFIMPENLVEASMDKYVDLYKQLNVPVFFIGTTKAHIPFVFDNVEYDEVADVSPVSYAAGYLYNQRNELGETWRFTKESSTDEKITDKEINKIYIDIFNTVEYIKENYVSYFP